MQTGVFYSLIIDEPLIGSYYVKFNHWPCSCCYPLPINRANFRAPCFHFFLVYFFMFCPLWNETILAILFGLPTCFSFTVVHGEERPQVLYMGENTIVSGKERYSTHKAKATALISPNARSEMWGCRRQNSSRCVGFRLKLGPVMSMPYFKHLYFSNHANHLFISRAVQCVVCRSFNNKA